MYHILILDDEEYILSALKRVLKKFDFKIDFFNDPEQAIRAAQSNPYDLFISDYKMPKMNGIDFLVEVRKLQPSALRIILSGFSEMQVMLDGINRAEIYRFVSKPWNDNDLVSTIEGALTYRTTLLENKILADKVRIQGEQISRQNALLDRLSSRHPELFSVKRADDGSIIIDDF